MTFPVGCPETPVSDPPGADPAGKPVDSRYMESPSLLVCGTLVRLVHCSAVLLDPVGKLNDVPEPVHWVFEAEILSGAPEETVGEMDPLWLEPSVDFESGSETGVLPLVGDPETLEVVLVWPEPEAEGLLGHVEPLDLESDSGKLNDVSVPDPDGLAGTPVDTDCPLDMGKLKDVLSPEPGLVLDSDGPEGAPVGVVCPLDRGKLKEVLWSPVDAGFPVSG